MSVPPEDAKAVGLRGGLSVLPVGVGSMEMAFPLDCVATTLPMPESQPLPAGPSYLRETIDFRGQPICVLDLAARLGMDHAAALVDRKLVLISGGATLAVEVDRIRDPEELSDCAFLLREAVGGAEHGMLREALRAIVRPGQVAGCATSLPVIDPRALLARGLLRRLPAILRSAASAGA